jgi:hypothetical protein
LIDNYASLAAKPQADQVSPDRQPVIFDQGINRVNAPPTPRGREALVVALPTDEPLRREGEHFLDAIVTGATPLTEGHSGLNVLEVLQPAQRSLCTFGQRGPLGQSTTDLVRL